MSAHRVYSWDHQVNELNLLDVPADPVRLADGRLLRIWCWEPHVESGKAVSVTLKAWIEVPEDGTPQASVPVQEPPDINITTMDTPEGSRAYLRRDGTTYLKEVAG